MAKKHSSLKTDLNDILKAAVHRSKSKKQTAVRLDEYFTLDDVDRILQERATRTPDVPITPILKPENWAAIPQEKRVLKAASLSDILGFNPQKQSSESHIMEHSEADVPQKWRPYYTKLKQMRTQLQAAIEDLDHNPPTEEMQAELFDDEFLNKEEMLKEVDAAIERIFKGTYGVCEITGQPILEKRLKSLPYTRYSLEGQEQLDSTQRERQRSQRAESNIYDRGDMENDYNAEDAEN